MTPEPNPNQANFSEFPPKNGLQEITVPVTQDVSGNPIENTKGEPLESELEVHVVPPAEPESNYPGKVGLGDFYQEVAERTRHDNIHSDVVAIVMNAAFDVLAHGQFGKALAVLGHGIDVAKKRAERAANPKQLAKR